MPLRATKALATLVNLGAYLIVSRECICVLSNRHKYLGERRFQGLHHE